MHTQQTSKPTAKSPAIRREGGRIYFTAMAQRRLFFYLTLAMLAWGMITMATGI